MTRGTLFSWIISLVGTGRIDHKSVHWHELVYFLFIKKDFSLVLQLFVIVVMCFLVNLELACLIVEVNNISEANLSTHCV